MLWKKNVWKMLWSEGTGWNARMLKCRNAAREIWINWYNIINNNRKEHFNIIILYRYNE